MNSKPTKCMNFHTTHSSAPIVVRNEWHLLNHPFYRAWVEGNLTLPVLQKYAQEYDHHVRAFPSYLQNAISLEEVRRNKSAQQVLAENLSEEDGSIHGISHPELWKDFAKGLGVAETELSTTKKPGAGISKVIEVFNRFTSSTWPQALGALYAYESQVPEIATSKIEGLQKHFNIHDEKTLAFFQVHEKADIAHRQSLEGLMVDFSKEEIYEAQRAADLACQGLWDFLTEMHNTKAI